MVERCIGEHALALVAALPGHTVNRVFKDWLAAGNTVASYISQHPA